MKITNGKYFGKRLLQLILCLFVIEACIVQISAEAEQNSEKTVRVGWYDSAFYSIDQFGRRSGYAYEYQQKIAAYTGWQYEAVSSMLSFLLNPLLFPQRPMRWML